MSFFDRFRSTAATLVQSPVSPDVDALTPLPPSEEGRRYQLNTLGQVCPFPLVEAKQAIAEGVATKPTQELIQSVEDAMWQPVYRDGDL